MNIPYQTLHCHTKSSDGVLTHGQVLDECLKNKIGVVAFTDHDCLTKSEMINELKKLNHPVKFVSGIEISCNAVKDQEIRMELFHVTGLFVDPTNEPLKTFCQQQLDDRVNRMKGFVQKLTALGFRISEQDILDISEGEAIGRPHMVAALSKYPENLAKLEDFFRELSEVAKLDPKRKAQLDDILSTNDEARRQNQKWYNLIMTRDALHSVYVDYSEGPIYMDDAVALIRGAGGIALIAHWSYLRDKLPIGIVEKFLKDNRLDGIETVYAFGNEKNKDLFDSDMAALASLCDKYDKIQGGGGDFHKPEDFALMLDPRFSDYAKRTKGMLEKIFQKHPDLNLTWTSLEE